MAIASDQQQEREIELLKKEIAALGEAQAELRLQIRSEADRVRLELEAIRETMEARLKGFYEEYSRNYDRIRKEFDPEAAA